MVVSVVDSWSTFIAGGPLPDWIVTACITAGLLVSLLMLRQLVREWRRQTTSKKVKNAIGLGVAILFILVFWAVSGDDATGEDSSATWAALEKRISDMPGTGFEEFSRRMVVADLAQSLMTMPVRNDSYHIGLRCLAAEDYENAIGQLNATITGPSSEANLKGDARFFRGIAHFCMALRDHDNSVLGMAEEDFSSTEAMAQKPFESLYQLSHIHFIKGSFDLSISLLDSVDVVAPQRSKDAVGLRDRLRKSLDADDR